jgi:hypothetical protein
MLKSHSELRKERNIPITFKQDSIYKHHDENIDRERDERVFTSMQVPKSIGQNLPFKQKQKVSVMNDMVSVDKKR